MVYWKELVVVVWAMVGLALHFRAAMTGKYSPAPELTLREVWLDFLRDPLCVLQLALTVAGCAFIVWAYQT